MTTNKNYYNGTIPFIKSAEIYFETTQEFLTDEGLQNSSAKWVSKGDLLFALYGANSGEVAVSKIDGVINQAVLCIKNDKQISDTTFLYNYFLMAKRFLVAKFLQGGQGNLSAQIIKQIQIPLPPLAEQEKIAQILGVWDKGISVLKSLIEAKTKRKKALMQRLLTPPCESPTPSLRASETSAAIYNKSVDCHDLTASNLAMTEKNSKAEQSLRFAEFTDKWQEMRLGDIIFATTSNLTLQNIDDKGEFPVFGANGLIGYINFYHKENECLGVVKDGAGVGRTYFLPKKSSALNTLQYIETNQADIKFVYYLFLNIKWTNWIKGSTIPHIFFNDYKNLIIKLPTLAEQKKIAQVLSACDKEIELLKAKFQCLKTQKKGLMQRLLNGKVRVKI